MMCKPSTAVVDVPNGASTVKPRAKHHTPSSLDSMDLSSFSDFEGFDWALCDGVSIIDGPITE